MKLEPITHSEVRKKNTSTVYECIYMEFRNMIMTTQYAKQKKKKTYIKNILLDSVGEGESGMI